MLGGAGRVWKTGTSTCFETVRNIITLYPGRDPALSASARAPLLRASAPPDSNAPVCRYYNYQERWNI